jgi:hypothetical protein
MHGHRTTLTSRRRSSWLYSPISSSSSSIALIGIRVLAICILLCLHHGFGQLDKIKQLDLRNEVAYNFTMHHRGQLGTEGVERSMNNIGIGLHQK